MKHIPQRTCVACRKVTSKRELLRLVRLTDGCVEVDTSGRKAGRGAYLCQSWECWRSGLKGDRVEHTLRTRLSEDNRQRLISWGEHFLPGVDSDTARQASGDL